MANTAMSSFISQAAISMKTLTPPMKKNNTNNLKYLRLIEFISDGVYRIELASKTGDVLSTICRVSKIDTNDVFTPLVINFDSEEFGKQMMRGLINSQPICHAITCFHAAQHTSKGLLTG